MRYPLSTLIFTSILLAACSSDNTSAIVEEGHDPVKQVCVNIEDFQTQRTTRTIGQVNDDNNISIYWTQGDTIGVYPTGKGSQVEFPISGGYGSSSAVFDGGGWTVKQGMQYVAYYPYSFYNRDNKHIKIDLSTYISHCDFTFQQALLHDYMVSSATAPVDGTIQFQFRHLFALVDIAITTPEAAQVSSITVETTPQSFPLAFEMDLSNGSAKLTQKKTASAFVNSAAQEFSTTSANQTQHLWLLLPTDNVTSLPLTITLNAGSKYSATIDPQVYASGKYYKHEVTLVRRTSGSGFNFNIENVAMGEGETIVIEK